MNRLSNKSRRRAGSAPPMLEEIESRTLLSAALAAPALPTVAVIASRPAASEISGAAAGKGTFTFVRTGKPTDALTVSYTISGSATSGVDFSALSGTVTFEAGKRSAKVDVTPLDDAIAEGKENAIVTLTAAGDYNVAKRSSAQVNIRDAAPTVNITTARNAIEAGLVNGRFRVTRTGNLDQPLTITYAATGSALSGTRFVALPGTITIPAGQRFAFINVTPIADNLSDPRENVILTLDPSTDFNLNSNIRLQSAAVNIMDTQPLQISAFAAPAISTFANSFAPGVSNNFASAAIPSFAPSLGTSSSSPFSSGFTPVSTASFLTPPVTSMSGIPGLTPLPTTSFTPVPVILSTVQTTSFAGGFA